MHGHRCTCALCLALAFGVGVGIVHREPEQPHNHIDAAGSHFLPYQPMASASTLTDALDAEDGGWWAGQVRALGSRRPPWSVSSGVSVWGQDEDFIPSVPPPSTTTVPA
jgi:hypothetical protein